MGIIWELRIGFWDWDGWDRVGEALDRLYHSDKSEDERLRISTLFYQLAVQQELVKPRGEDLPKQVTDLYYYSEVNSIHLRHEV